MAQLDLNNVVCISLKSHNKEQMEAIAATIDVSLEYLLKAKAEGCKKIWLQKGGGIVVAGLDTDNPEDVYFSPEYLPMTAKMRKAILSLKPMKTPKTPSFLKPGYKQGANLGGHSGPNGQASSEDAIPDQT